MLRRRTLTVLAVGALVAAGPSLAGASVTYTLAEQVYTFATPQGGRVGDFQLSFTVSDAAVARGSFFLTGLGSSSNTGQPNSPVYAGDLADFGCLSFRFNPAATPTFLAGTLSVFSVAFTSLGDISNFSLEYRGVDEDASLRGTSLVSGFIGQDNVHTCGSSMTSQDCGLSGRLVRSNAGAVPEPMSTAVLGVGLPGMTTVRRRRG